MVLLSSQDLNPAAGLLVFREAVHWKSFRSSSLLERDNGREDAYGALLCRARAVANLSLAAVMEI